MLSDFFMDRQKTTQRRKFVMWVVTVKLLKMTAMSKETSVICIKERNHGKNKPEEYGMNSAQGGCQFSCYNKSQKKGGE
jgi:hypothetical protein